MKSQLRVWKCIGTTLIIFFIFQGCGGQRPVIPNPAPLGFVPFTSDEMAPESEELNPKLLRALHYSGRFRVVPLLEKPGLWNLTDLQRFSMQVAADTLTAIADSSAIHALPDTLESIAPPPERPASAPGTPRWVLTGAFVREVELTGQGTLIPYLFFRPSTRIVAELEYRLYDTQKQQWIEIGRIRAEEKRRGKSQVLDYDPVDPSLALTATERQLARDHLYNQLFEKLIATLEGFTHATK